MATIYSTSVQMYVYMYLNIVFVLLFASRGGAPVGNFERSFEVEPTDLVTRQKQSIQSPHLSYSDIEH